MSPGSNNSLNVVAPRDGHWFCQQRKFFMKDGVIQKNKQRMDNQLERSEK